jgi:hypothetical protein
LKKPAFWKDYRWFVISGILLGLTCLTRSVYQLSTLLAVYWIWGILKERKKAIVVLITAWLVTAPWIIRNSILYHEPTGFESAIGYDLYLGYHPDGTGTFQYPQSLDLMTILDDSIREKIGLQKSLEFILADPARIPYLFLRRAGYFFGLERRAFTYFYSNNYFGHLPQVVLALILSILCLPFTLVCASGLMGMAITEWGSKNKLLFLFLIGYISPHLLIIAEDRFHLAIVPVLAILAAGFWNGGGQSIRRRWLDSVAGKVALIVATVGILLLCASWGFELLRDSDKLALLSGPNGNHTYFSY